MKKSYYLLTFLPVIISILSLFFMPNEIPCHFNLNGEITRFGNKYEILICPLLIMAFSFFLSRFYKFAPTENKKGVYNLLLITLGIFNVLEIAFILIIFLAQF